jgi:hypothetical protein
MQVPHFQQAIGRGHVLLRAAHSDPPPANTRHNGAELSWQCCLTWCLIMLFITSSHKTCINKGITKWSASPSEQPQ